MNTASPAAARRRRWAYVLLALVVLLVIAAALTWRFRISVAEMVAEQNLRLMGLDGIAFDIAEVEADRVRLENLRIGDNGPSAEAATLTFSPGGLMNGELRPLSLVQPSITIIEDADGAMSIQADMQVSGLEAPAVSVDIVAVAGEVSHGAVSLSIDGVGGFGFVGLTADMAQDRRFVAKGAKGDINAALATMILPGLKSKGQTLFDMDMNVPITPLMSGAALSQVISESGERAEIKLAIPKLSYGDSSKMAARAGK